MSNAKKRRGLRLPGGLMEHSIYISVAVCVAIFAAFLVNYVIIHKWYREEAVSARESFFEQIVSTLEEMEEDIAKISDSVNVSSTVVDYIHAEPLTERWNLLREVQQFASNLMKLEEHIMALNMYDAEGALIAMEGIKYAPLSELPENGETLRISDCVQMEGDTGSYFQAVIPVYEKQERGSLVRAGSVALLFSSERLQEIVQFAAAAYSEEDTYIAVTDRRGKILAEAGDAAVSADYAGDGEESGDYLYFRRELSQSGWQVVYTAKHNSYMYYMNRVQIVNILTYVVTITALLYLCGMMYRKVMQPLKRQMAFVVNYTKDTRQRMEVWDETEFGELEKEFNEMLDRIEELNRKIIEEQERNLALEYSKKQTEILAYKNQINPHFMHNTLECIRGMAVYRGEREIAKLTEAMSRMFQYNVRGGEIVTVERMLRSIRDYAVIIEYRFMGRISVRVEAEEAALACTLPKMLVQPLVENAVQHGLEPKVEKGTVELAVTREEGWLWIRVGDDGVGMTNEELERQRSKFAADGAQTGSTEQADAQAERAGQGGEADGRDLSAETVFGGPADGGHREIGLANVARRLQLFYGGAYRLEIRSREGEGSEFLLQLPTQGGAI